MQNFLSTLILSAFVCLVSIQAGAIGVSLSPNTPQFRFLEAAEARTFLETPDAYTKALKPLEISMKQGIPGNLSEADHLIFIGRQALAWNPQDEAIFRTLAGQLNSTSQNLGFKILMPTEILVIRTTDKIDFGAHTRRNAIILPEGVKPRTILHEYFHVLSRYNPELRDKLYAIAGFKRLKTNPTPKEVKERLLTNPDALEHYSIDVEYNQDVVSVIPVLLSRFLKEELTFPIDLSQILIFRLLKADGTKLIGMEETDYLKRIRANSSYILHPEEIMADNFEFLIQRTLKVPLERPLPYPEALDRLHEVLSGTQRP